MINSNNNMDNYTNYINIMNPINLIDNELNINGMIVNLYDLSIYNKKQKVVITFNNSLNSSKLYAIFENSYSLKNYTSTMVSSSSKFKLSIDQINNLSSTIQYANIIFSDSTIDLYDTLSDSNKITFAINPFTITPNYTNPSQFIIQDNINLWNNYLVSIDLKLTYINNILTCQIDNKIVLINYTSLKPIILSYNKIIINKFISVGNGIFIVDPTTIPTIPISSYELPNFILKNVTLSSPDISTPLSFLDISITPIYQ